MRRSSFFHRAIGLALLSLCGCGGGGGGSSSSSTAPDPSPASPITIRGIRVVGAVSEACTVSAEGVPDSDPAPTAFALPVPFSDPGMRNPIAATVTVLATDTAGNRVSSRIIVTADPGTTSSP